MVNKCKSALQTLDNKRGSCKWLELIHAQVQHTQHATSNNS